MGKSDAAAVQEDHRLQTGIPKYAHLLENNPTRRMSADEATWAKYSEEAELPQYAEAVTSRATAPYTQEVQGHKQRGKCRSIFGLPMLRPEGNIATAWLRIAAFTDITYTAFLVPLSFAFFHDVRIFNWMSILDIIGGILYYIDLFMNFHIGIALTRSMHARLVLDGRLVAGLYIKRSTFLVDLFATLPLIPEVVLLCINTPAGRLKAVAEVVAWIRLARMLRLLPLLRSLAVLDLTGPVNRRLLSFMPSSLLLGIHCLYMFCFVANMVANIWYYTAHAEGLQNSWLRSVGSVSDDLTAAGGVTKYVASFYFAVTVLSTVGYGDITATTTPERVVATVAMVIGIAFFGFLLNVLQTVIQRAGSQGRRNEMFRERLPHIQTWMRQCELPEPLRRKIRSYYAEVWCRHWEVDEQLLFDQLSYHLRAEIAIFLTDKMLSNSKAFGNLDDAERGMLSAMLRPEPLAPGHDLFLQGSDADSMYLLQDGACALYRNMVEIESVDAPSLIGELAILNAPMVQSEAHEPHTRLYTVRAVNLCMLWRVRISDLVPLLNIRPQLVVDLLKDVQNVMTRLNKLLPSDDCWKQKSEVVERCLAEAVARTATSNDETAQAADDTTGAFAQNLKSE